MVQIKSRNFESVGKMSTTWPKLIVLLLLAAAFLLGQCQAHSEASHEAGKVNNVTLTPPGLIVAQGTQQHQQEEDEERGHDQLTPHAAPSSQRKLSRGKRFVAFPQGSSASVSQRTIERWHNLP